MGPGLPGRARAVGHTVDGMATDGGIRRTISDLVAQERELREQLAQGEITGGQEHERLRAIEVELDQCWDLLRQRGAAREFGGDPDAATVRDPGTVENYLD
ncbi:Protein of unknown function [Cellulosimicrobium aquatile]|uniref:DUF2630 family protein n=2 Tax=Cellulosimicrobium TaxID=157920 RepID=A0A1N6PWI0_9MICO|nr:Sensor-type histidine kinase prrB [Mycobacteroides abscessus]SIQ08549.1 Protein of unknown function [Cellulosimicrobium aquatile]